MGYSKRAVQREDEERARLVGRPHEVLMRFERFPKVWTVRFTPVASDWVLGVYNFADSEKIRNIFRRFAVSRLNEDWAALDYAIERGNGLAKLRLGDEEYAALQKPKRR